MAKWISGPYVYADDKDLSDLLMSNAYKPSQKQLLAIARNYGIFLPNSAERSVIISALVKLNIGFNELTVFVDAAETPDRKEKQTTQLIHQTATPDVLANVIETVTSSRKDSGEKESCSQVTRADGTIELTINYIEQDPSKNLLRQWREKTTVLELYKTDSGEIGMRHDANEKVTSIANQIAKGIVGPDSSPEKVQKVELCVIDNADVRTTFFLKLMENVEKYSLKDVVVLKLVKIDGSDEDSDPDDDASSLDDQITGIVRKLEFDGSRLLQSNEYKQMKEAGFAINHARWRGKLISESPMEVIFEAGFRDGQNAKDFIFSIGGIYKQKESGEIAVTKSTPDKLTETKLKTLLEKAAFNAMKHVMESFDLEHD